MFGNPITLVDAEAGETFSSLSLASADYEAELFFAESIDGGYAFELQHLSLDGVSAGSLVLVATGEVQAPPWTSVASDGHEIACCWESYGTDPDPYGNLCALTSPIVTCNSVSVGGTSPDDAMDGGFVGCGTRPSVAVSEGYTSLTYLQEGGIQLEQLYLPWGNGLGGPGPYFYPSDVMVPVNDGFKVVLSDGGVFGYWNVTAPIQIDGPRDDAGYPTLNPVATVTNSDSFGVTSNGQLLAFSIELNSVAMVLVMDADGGSASALVAISSTSESALASVAAAPCTSGFGFSYAVDGGNVMFRQTGLDGTPMGTASTLIANLGTNAQQIALTATDGGLLLAVQTPGQIGVYFVACF